MVKKTLKSALRAHEEAKKRSNKLQSAQAAAQEAAKRKAVSIKSGKQPKRQRKENAHRQKEVHVQPFESQDTILLVGEGNFSFAHSLLLPPNNHDPDLLLATALDSERECYEKYPDARNHVEEIRRLAGRESIVIFGVDAGALEGNSTISGRKATDARDVQLPRWSKVVFNFPHIGAGHKDESRNVLANQLMLLRFLVSVAPLLSVGPAPAFARTGKESVRELSVGSISSAGEEERETSEGEGVHRTGITLAVPPYAGSVLITLRNTKPYTLWDVPMLAKRLPSVYASIAKSAPSLNKGMKAPSPAQVDRLLHLGQGRAYRVWRSFQFRHDLYSGYSHRRTIGWKEGQSKGDNEDILRSNDGENRTWQLGLSD